MTVSIMIPVYNREDCIGACIESALKQTYADIEVIVLDNASSDGTWDICRQYAAQDARVRVFRNERNVGPVRNWLACLDRAEGEFGKLLFSDDVMRPDCLELCMPMFADDVGFVFSQVMLGETPWHGSGACAWQSDTGIFAASDFIRASLFSDHPVPVSPCAAVFRLRDIRNALETPIDIPGIKDFLDYGAGPDLFIYLASAASYAKVGYRAEMLTFFREHANSISTRHGDIVPERYAQTRMFFAGERMGFGMFRQVLMLEWLTAMKRRRTLLVFADFQRHNCNVRHRASFNLAAFAAACFRLMRNVIKGRLA
ncbi:MAG TPA: glycosyltransferase family 2 protein [Mariprofundaceae bacterium]|nr:glycosyltransferase family 2 protein [Mariprofundaceae bacterium]